ncbi:MAG TPA: hypothetical protein VF637_11245 [Sphingomicrobium sp.]|jgi:hypothetical protein
MRKFMIVTISLAATACVNTSDRIATELTGAGLNASQARCVGQSLERDLSLGQIRQLANAARAYQGNDTTPGRLTLSDLVRTTAPIHDPKVAVAVARAAATCA